MEVQMFSQFQSIAKSSVVAGELTPKEFLNLIKNPGKNKEQIILARIFHQYGDMALYSEIKKTKIPAFTLNSSFHKRRRNNDIKDLSKLVFIDIDGSTRLNLNHPLIFASWISLSGSGRGVLVKAPYVNYESLKKTYLEIGEELEVDVDKNAAKITQLTALSFDPNVYINENSLEYIPNNLKKVVHSTYKKNNPTIGTVAPFEYDLNLRFSNLKQFVRTLNFNGEAAILTLEEVELAEVKIPSPIPEGKRNSTLAGICYQIRALNPNISFSILSKILFWINKKHCHPPYPTRQLTELVQNIFKLSIENLSPIKNITRRVFYNPDYDLSSAEKRSLSRKLLNKERTEKTILKIEEALVSWDFNAHKKVTQKAIAEKAGVSLSSVKKYYKLFKPKIEILRRAFIRPP